MLRIGRVEEPLRLLAAHDGRARQHRRQGPPFVEQRGRLHLELVHERNGGDRRAGADRRLQPVELDERIPDRCTEVEDHVRVVAEARPLPHLGLGERRHRNDRQPTGLRALGDLDRDGSAAAGAEDEHHVRRLQLEVGEDRLRQALDPLDEHRLALAVGADDLRVEGHRELDDRVEARIGAVAREHLLDRDPRVAGAEQMHEAAARDRVGTEAGDLGHGRALRLEPFQQRFGGLEVPRRLDAHVVVERGGSRTVVGHRVSMLGTGLIGLFYTRTLHGQRNRDRVQVVYSRSEDRAKAFCAENGVPEWTTDLEEAIASPETDTVVIGLPNQLHEQAVELCATHGKAVLCTKPLARTADEAKRMLDTVERAGVFGGYLEDLVYTPKTLKAMASVQAGQIGDVLWARSRETHPGPHSAWFWDAAQAGGGPIVDLGCHCIEIIRSYMGKDNRPVEVMCWTDTLVHPIEAEENAIALIRFESGAMGQFEVSWTFRGGMDLRDEVAGTEGTIWTNHFLRTGFEVFTSGAGDGYVVNAIIDACYRSAETRQWEQVQLEDWRGAGVPRIARERREHDGRTVIKEEKMPDGRSKLILKDERTGEFVDVVS